MNQYLRQRDASATPPPTLQLLGPFSGGGEASQFSPFMAVRRHPLAIAAIVLVITAAVAGIAAVIPSRYDATASVVIQNRPGKLNNMQAVAAEREVDPNLVGTQIEILRSPAVARRVVERLRLDDSEEFGGPAHGLVDNYTTPAIKALTGNDTTIYAIVFVDPGRDGPVVIDSPKGVYGVIDDWWQRPIVEVGPFGPDKGQGGKFLLLPLNGGDNVADGYLPAKSKTNRAMFIGRAFVKDGDVKSAVDTLTGIKVYPLAQASAPPQTRIVHGGDRPMNSIAPRGFEYWELLADVIKAEPVEERDRFFHAMLKPLGIEKGKPFAPDARQKKILTEAAEVGFLMAQTLSMAPRLGNASAYPGTHWEWVLTLNPNQEAKDYSQLDERTDYTFEAITVAEGMVKPIIGAGSQYMGSAKDKDGQWLDGGRAYTLRVPANVPAKEFWAVTVYDVLTRSMIDTDTKSAGVSSNRKLRTNADGSVDIYFGPEAPKGGENWIKTIPGRGWFAYFRWYGPTEPFFDKSWKLSDIEKAN